MVEQMVFGSRSADFAAQFAEPLWPDVGLNRGRVICCLFSTYLC
jgi:hypothetical protein